MVDIRLPDPRPPLPHGARTSGPGTPVTMEGAFAFGFRAGFGFICAQLLVGAVVAIAWVVLPQVFR